MHSYVDAVRETAYVESTVDGDRDGKLDRIAADIIRPAATQSGLRVPVIMIASPYFREPSPEAARAGTDPAYLPIDGAYKDGEDDGSPSKFPDFYDNYFVPRGYAVVLVDVAGTRASDGCATSGGRTEVLGTKAVVDWIGGRANAVDKSGAEVKARWSTGAVGMIGRSWAGTHANALATMDLPNLKTIVPIAAISNWYDYMRINGQPRFTDYPRYLANYVGRDRLANPEECAQVWNELATQSADDTGNYNGFWAERNYLADVSKVKASVLMVHGLNDYNVLTSHGQQFWQGLTAANVPRKLWLHQAAHVDPFRLRPTEWIDTLHRWFDQWLYGINTGIMDLPAVDIEQEPLIWKKRADWPQGSASRLYFGPAEPGAAGTLTSQPPTPPGIGVQQVFKDSFTQTEPEMIADADQSKPNRLLFLSKPLASDLRISGVPEVSVRAALTAGGGPLTALLVDYGEGRRLPHVGYNGDTGLIRDEGELCVGAGDAVDTGCFAKYKEDIRTTATEVVSEGWLNTKHRESLRYVSPTTPGTAYDFSWKLQPEDYVFKAGHRIGVVIAATDCSEMFEACDSAAAGQDPWPLASVTASIRLSSITLPVAPL